MKIKMSPKYLGGIFIYMYYQNLKWELFSDFY